MLDQEVSTSLRWYPVVDCLGLLLQHTGGVVVVGAVHVGQF